MRAKLADLWAIVPMRGIGTGKTRLAAILDAVERARLNRQLLAHTIAAIKRSRIAAQHCVVVSGCARALRIARDAGVLALREPRPRRGLNAAVGHAMALARRRGARRVLVLPADLPLLSASVVRRLTTRRWDGQRLALAPDRANTGTNVMLVTRRHAIAFQFGPGSFSKHRALVGRSELAVCRMPELMLDLDTVDDLGVWRRMSSGIVRPR